jgi:hypothetical protein
MSGKTIDRSNWRSRGWLHEEDTPRLVCRPASFPFPDLAGAGFHLQPWNADHTRARATINRDSRGDMEVGWPTIETISTGSSSRTLLINRGT